MNRKGQTGIEALVLMGIVLIVATVVFFSINQRNLNVVRARQHLGAQGEVSKVANAINDAAIGGEGYRRNVTVAKRAGPASAHTFEVDGDGRKVEMQWQGPRNETRVASAGTITSDVEDASLSTGSINVNNTGETIQVRCWNDDETQLQEC